MTLSAGSIVFTGFNADGNDNLAFAVLEDIAAGTQIHFSDRTWDGAAFTTLETFWTWTATADVAAGTVVRIDNFDSGTLTADVGSVAFSATNNRGFSASGETIYAYTGPDATTPVTFLAAIASKGFGLDDGGVLDNTGLVAGQTALSLGDNGGVDVGAYAGGRDGQVDFAAYRALANDAANWTTQDDTGDQSADGIGPDVPFSATGFSVLPCFAPGTLIATPGGARPVEALAAGDHVVMADGGVRVLVWAGSWQADAGDAAHRAVRIRAGAFGAGRPARDLLVSANHAVRLEGVLVPAGNLLDGARVVREAGCPARYHHIATAEHGVVLAEGLAVETFCPLGAVPYADAPRVTGALPRLEQGAALRRLRARLGLAAGTREHPLEGFVERVAPVPGGVVVEGWAADGPDGAELRLCAGAMVVDLAANRWRSDLDRAGLPAAGFSVRLPVPHGVAVSVRRRRDGAALAFLPGVAAAALPLVSGATPPM